MALFDNFNVVYVLLAIVYLIHISLIISNIAADYYDKCLMGYQSNYIALIVSLLCMCLLSFWYYRNQNGKQYTPSAAANASGSRMSFGSRYGDKTTDSNTYRSYEYNKNDET